MSKDSRFEILLTGSSVWVCLVVSYQGRCGSSQCNLPDRMLQLDGNTTLNQNYVLWLTLLIRAGMNISHLFVSGILAHGRWYISHCFFLYFFLSAVVLSCLLCSACILQTCSKPNQFLIQIKVYFFSNLSFCPSFKLLLSIL